MVQKGIGLKQPFSFPFWHPLSNFMGQGSREGPQISWLVVPAGPALHHPFPLRFLTRQWQVELPAGVVPMAGGTALRGSARHPSHPIPSIHDSFQPFLPTLPANPSCHPSSLFQIHPKVRAPSAGQMSTWDSGRPSGAETPGSGASASGAPRVAASSKNLVDSKLTGQNVIKMCQ